MRDELKATMVCLFTLTIMGCSKPAEPASPTPVATSTVVPADYPLPVPAGAVGIKYRVIKKAPILDFEVDKPLTEIRTFYETKLPEQGWTITREKDDLLKGTRGDPVQLVYVNFEEQTGQKLFVRILLSLE